MEMTNEEICRNYRQAKYRQRQIKILADENLCSVEEIRRILIDSGVLIPRIKKALSGSVAIEKSAVKEVSADWKTSLKAVMERISELKQIRDTAEKELSEIYQTLGTLCEKE